MNLVVFTDLDGTLLDHDTYDWAPASEALDACRRRGVPVILVSSKTRAEMEVLRAALDLPWPVVSENGGGIAFPEGAPLAPPPEAEPAEGGRILRLGAAYATVVRALRAIRRDLGRPDLRGFSDMDVHEIARRTGLDLESAERAAAREYDEPLVTDRDPAEDLAPLAEAARARGLQATAGGRFLHLFGGCDKGEAVRRLLDRLRARHPGLRSAALGDGPNDRPMLEQVDVPVLVPGSGPLPVDRHALPGLRIARAPGPAGWNRAVLDLLEEDSRALNPNP